MVQLNTTFDSTINQKIFVLKGDEGYARTTDVIASLNTSFSDFDSHMGYCHVGLDIEVVREIGDSTLLIFNNDELLYSIPYSDSHMDEIIDSDWNEKGVYWEDNHLVIGKKESDPLYINTGLFLLYDTEHHIKVRYLGNKNCLGSHENIVFNIPTPTAFESTLTLSSSSQRYLPNDTIDDVTLLFESENTIENTKSVKIYDNDVFLQTVTVTKDVPLTLDLGTFSDGLHTLKAVFEGDDEAYASETTYDISVGYKVMNATYPQYVIDGQTGSFTCTLRDYLDKPIVGEYISVSEYIDGYEWEQISQEVQTDSDGKVTIQPVNYSNKPFAMTINDWHDVTHTTDIVTVDDVTVDFWYTNESYYNETTDYTATVHVWHNNDEITHKLPIEYTETFIDGTSITRTLYANDVITGNVMRGLIEIECNVIDTDVSTTQYYHNMDVLYGSSTYSGGKPTLNNVSEVYSSFVVKYVGGSGNVRDDNRATVGWYIGGDGDDKVTWNIEFTYMGSSNVTSGYESYINGLKIGRDIPKLKAGDKIKIVRKPDKTNEFYINDALKKTHYYQYPTFFYITLFKRSTFIMNGLRIERVLKSNDGV